MELTRFGGHLDVGCCAQGRRRSWPDRASTHLSSVSRLLSWSVRPTRRWRRSLVIWGQRHQVGQLGHGRPGRAGVSDTTGRLPVTAAERAELTKLRRENAKLKVDREILKKTAGFFVSESTRWHGSPSSMRRAREHLVTVMDRC
jgi:transposase-like protein